MDRVTKSTTSAAAKQRNDDAAAVHDHDDGDPCRCKKVSVMTPRQLLGTMLRDLSFWKKAKKDNDPGER